MENDTMSQFDKDRLEYAAYELVGWTYVLLALCTSICTWAMTRRTSQTEVLSENYAGMLYGVVTGISDGDGFRFFHCPWLRSRSCTREDNKLYVRLAGIDAPEMGSSRMPGQFFSGDSKAYLSSLIQGKSIKIKVVGVDQYDRVLAVAYLPRWFLRWFFFNRIVPLSVFEWFLWFPIKLFEWFLWFTIKLFEFLHVDILRLFLVSFFEWLKSDLFYINVNLKLVENGYACVYRGRDAIYDHYEGNLTSLEEKAKKDQKGMWQFPNLETPMRFKRLHREGKR